MGDIKVYPSRLNGEVKIPPSKSMAHRAVICAALGDGLSKISNIDYSDDIIATINGMSKIIDTISLDKKNIGNVLKVILLKSIGESIIYDTTSDFFKVVR